MSTNRKPIKFIVPRIHVLKDFYFIQWVGHEYYIKRDRHRFTCKYRLRILEMLLLCLILIIEKAFPPNTHEDILRLFLLAIASGMLSGVAVADYINTEKNRNFIDMIRWENIL